MSTKSILSICAECDNCYKACELCEIEADVRGAAQKIIEAKKATYYGIAVALLRIVKAIFGDEKSVFTVSAYLDGEYGQKGIYAGVPCIVSRNGIERIVELDLTEEELSKLDKSCKFLSSVIEDMSTAAISK